MTSSPDQDPVIDLEPFAPDTPLSSNVPAVDGPGPGAPAHVQPPYDDERGQPGVLLMSASLMFGVIWSIGSGLMLSLWYGSEALFNSGPERLFGFLFVTIGPGLLIACLGFLGREMVRFTTKAKELEMVAAKLAAPVAGAKGDARRMADAIASEVTRIGEAADGALTRLGAMEEVLRHHSDAVQEASSAARGQVDQMIEDLRSERTAVTEMVDALADEAKRISETIERQAEMVSAAADLAGAHASESRQLLEKAAERLAAAGGSAQQSGEKAAFAISEQMRDMDALVTALDERASRLENVANSQQSNLKLAQKTAHELALASEAGSGAMRESVEAAVEHARRLTDLVADETRSLTKKTTDDIELIRATADAARMASEDAGRSLETTAATVVAHMDKIKDAGRFSAGAEDAFQSRMGEVEGLMVKMEERLSQAMGRMNAASVQPPVSSAGRRASAPRNLDPFDDLAADEPPARARRHEPEPPRYRERDRGSDRGADRERDRDRDRDRFPRDVASRRNDPPPPPFTEDDPPPPRRPGAPRDAAPPRQSDDLRRRRDDRPPRDSDFLDDRPSSSRLDERRPSRPAFERDDTPPPPPRARPDDEDRPEAPGVGASTRDQRGERGWRWKDLLRDAEDGAGAGSAPRGGGDDIVAGLRRAGVDPNDALDPDMTARIARARRRAGSGEARALVIDSALDDVRRTATALASDPSLRARAEAFIDEQSRLVRRAVDQNDARGLGALFDSDSGRAFLLIDAALSDG